jgi:hypothetical protein
MSLIDREWFHRKENKPQARPARHHLQPAEPSPPGLATACLIALVLVAGVLLWRFA